MTQNQIKYLTNVELLAAFKNKTRCFYTWQTADKIFKEILKRDIDLIDSNKLHTAKWHSQYGWEGPEEFDELMDKIIEKELNRLVPKTKLPRKLKKRYLKYGKADYLV